MSYSVYSIDKIENVYHSFRRAQSICLERPFRMPKNFRSHFNKFGDKTKQNIIKITGFFDTIWQNIDPLEYFKCGFDLYGKNFSYHVFFKEDILRMYISRDKIKKREMNNLKKNLIESAKFVKKWMRENKIDSLWGYINSYEVKCHTALEHYMKNYIDSTFFVYLIKNGLKLSDTERGMTPYISRNYRNISDRLDRLKDFVKKMEDNLI